MLNMHGISQDGADPTTIAVPAIASGTIASEGSPTTSSRLSATEENILSRQLPGRQSPYIVPLANTSQMIAVPGQQRQLSALGHSPSDTTTIGSLLAANSPHRLILKKIYF